MKSSDYINIERRDYSLYVLQQRAIPHAADGLKSSARRVLWIGKDGKSYKSAVLAGATMPIHPHQAPEGAVNTLAAPYTNNIPLLKGDGTFGTLLNPTAYGAARYTSVKVSKFTQDVVFRDIEIIPMQDNYDGTLKEPKHFLPLVPIVLLNPQSGIAVGFASNILPHTLPDIIKSQLSILEDKPNFIEETPELTPINQKATGWVENGTGYKAIFQGEFLRTGATTVKITNLPYGILHEKYKNKYLDPLEENGTILEYTDNSKNKYDIDIKFKRGVLRALDDDKILELLGLTNYVSENLTVISFDGTTVWHTTYQELVTQFCEWRLTWYYNRYERLADLLKIDIQKYKDILLAIDKNIGNAAIKIQSRTKLKEHLSHIGIIYVDYISDLPVYRFTQEERKKTELKLSEANKLLASYNNFLRSKSARREKYIEELNEILTNFKRGKYNE